MNPDKKTDYKTLQIYAWYFYGLSSCCVLLAMCWLGWKIAFDPIAPSSSGLVLVVVNVIVIIKLYTTFKQKIQEIKAT